MDDLECNGRKVVEVDYGIASCYDDTIEINRKLKNLPHLKKALLKHEMNHRNGRYNLDDLKNDFGKKKGQFFGILRFAAKNPECMVNFFPFMYSYYFKEWTYNLSSIPPLLFLGAIFSLFFKLTVGFPILYSALVWLLLVLFLNGFFLLVAHRYVKKQKRKRWEI